MSQVQVFTIGFTKTSAEEFFEKLKREGVRTLIDIRLNNVSQLAGYAKKNDLEYFLKEICDCSYIHKPTFAPTKNILDGYKKKEISWEEYERQFNNLISERKIEEQIKIEHLAKACFLCSEKSPLKCHRRLVVEYLNRTLSSLTIKHL